MLNIYNKNFPHVSATENTFYPEAEPWIFQTVSGSKVSLLQSQNEYLQPLISKSL